jgi:hypothetical protein
MTVVRAERAFLEARTLRVNPATVINHRYNGDRAAPTGAEAAKP